MIEKFKIFEPFKAKLEHGLTTRETGSFHQCPDETSDSLKKLPEGEYIFANQVHGKHVVDINEENTKVTEGADAFITNKKGIGLAIKLADCQGILLYDPVKEVIAAIHAGWKGIAKKIIAETIHKMQKVYDVNPSDLHAAVSPSLGSCCSEFSDPEQELPTFMIPYIFGKHVDLWKAGDDQLKEVGIRPENIERTQKCTRCHHDIYYSYRHGDEGRMACFIMLRK